MKTLTSFILAFLLGISVFARAGATSGQVPKWNGITWAPADDVSGGGGFTLPYAGTANDAVASLKVTNTNATNEAAGIYGINSSTTGKGNGVLGE